MPQSLTTDLLQRRHDKLFCAHRTYLKANATQYAYGIYQGYVLEVMLHEWLLGSEHRTTDPAEADWFFVPVYATCAIVTAIFGTPTTRPTRYRLAIASRLYLRAYEHVRTSLPYWNASGGANHIWAFGYDEGACFAPAPLRPSLPPSRPGSAHGSAATKVNPTTRERPASAVARMPPPPPPSRPSSAFARNASAPRPGTAPAGLSKARVALTIDGHLSTEIESEIDCDQDCDGTPCNGRAMLAMHPPRAGSGWNR
jgi:hypothetical protein